MVQRGLKMTAVVAPGNAHGLKLDGVPELLEADQVLLDCLAVTLGDDVSASLLIDAGRIVQQVGGDR